MNEVTNLKYALIKGKKSPITVSFKGFLTVDAFLDDIALRLDNGADFIVFDTKGLSDSQALELGFKILQLASIFSAIFIIKSRVDIAKILNANGVYLSFGDINLKQAKMILDNEKLIGSDSEIADFSLDNNIITVNLPSKGIINDKH